MSREDCTTCERAKMLDKVLLCTFESRVKTDTTKVCEYYKPKYEQVVFK